MELIGLLDTLEATILSGRKVFFTDKVMLNESRLLEIIDKMRILIKSGKGAVKKAIENVSINDPSNEKVIISKAQREARIIREGANIYAEETLANLLSTVMKLERTIQNGRSRLDKMRLEDKNI